MSISVCLASYNGEKFIELQLKSIISQLGKEDEIIIVEDCSRDNTLSIIKSINDKRIKSFKAEIVLKSGFLSWDDLLDKLFGFRKEYKLYRGELESFEIIEEWTEDGKIMYVEPFFLS